MYYIKNILAPWIQFSINQKHSIYFQGCLFVTRLFVTRTIHFLLYKIFYVCVNIKMCAITTLYIQMWLINNKSIYVCLIYISTLHQPVRLNFDLKSWPGWLTYSLWFGWVHKTAGSRPRDLSSSLRSSCSYLQTSTERMKGERGHLNQQQLTTEQMHTFLIFCGIYSLQKTNFPRSNSSTNSKKQHV